MYQMIKSRLFINSIIIMGAILVLVALILYWLLFIQITNSGLDFQNVVAIPPEMTFTETKQGIKEFDLVVQTGETEFLPGQLTATSGVNGTYLGPTIRARLGDYLVLNVHNQLNEDTTMHWHGMHVPAIMDGTPHQVIQPETTWTAEYTITQQAGLMWYHPHIHHRSGPQVYQGIAGLFILDDDHSDSLNLPNTYGVDDIPLIIQDRLFNDDGSFLYQARNGAVYGTEILVNGTYNPHVVVEARNIRFRILNGSNARIYYFGFEDQRTFKQIATDGGLLEKPVETNRIRLAPGERAEIIVDFSDGQPALVKSFPEDFITETLDAWFSQTGNGHFDILEIRVEPATTASHDIPDVLNTIDRWTADQANQIREMVLGQMIINGKSMDMARIDETVRLDDIEIWEINNQAGRSHPFHIHLVQFLILDRDGQPPLAQEAGWKDTVLVDSGETVNVIMQFTQYADPDNPYMYHCHILEHEDNGMMGQFVVVDE